MNPSLPKHPGQQLSSSLLCQLVAICLIIFGAKLWLIGSYGSPLPFLDQWQGEGAEVLRPWVKGELGFADLVRPFNEHRILPTRLLVLALFEGNARQWDAQVQMVAGAVLHAGCAFFLGALFLGHFKTARWSVFASLLVLFCLPFDWQNTLWGFQSQFYFLILFTFGAVWGLAGHPAGSTRWWLGAGSGLLACVSMGSGGFAGLALAGWAVIQLLISPEARRHRSTWASLGLSLALGILGFILYTPPAKAALTRQQVQTPLAFLHNLGLHLSWPQSGSPFLALLTFAPLVILFVLWVRRIRTATPGSDPAATVENFLFPLGLWLILQAAALAYCRNGPAVAIISRYMDLLAVGPLVNLGALLRLAQLAAQAPAPRWPRRAVLGGAVVWSALAIAGLFPLVQRNLRLDLPGLKQICRVQAQAVRQFIHTDQMDAFGGKQVFGLEPNEFEMLADLLRDPSIQAILPTGLGIRRVAAAPGPLSSASQALASEWMLILGAGSLLLLLVAINDNLTHRRAKAGQVSPATLSWGKPAGPPA